ncbi:MAG: aminopeptidase [Bacilli bacterium]|nr:aminopeptidase [Bacilli bacterium]
MNEKIKKLAETIVNYSLNVKEDEHVLITYQSIESRELVKELINQIVLRKGIPFTNYVDPFISNLLKEKTTSKRIELIKEYQQFELDHFDSFINIKYNLNDYETKNIPDSIRDEIKRKTYEIHDKIVNERKWVLLNYPSYVDGFKSKMKYEDFLNYSFDVMTIDYSKMSEDIKPLQKLMDKTNKVRIIGKDTDITFSIKGMKSVPCTGEMNIPDGEIFSCPIKNSVNGVITYNTTSTYNGEVFSNIRLEFKDGKIINATCNEEDKNEKLNKIFDTDEGSRYVGEFSLGLNPKVLHPMGDILFDEKIIGSIHFTPGAAYKECYNGNDSNIHWDLVLIQRKEYGGGELYFDDVLIRKDGLFVIDELEHLNYDLTK